MKVAVIPARKGSKRIPGKNIKLFHGKPMLYWPIKSAIKSGVFNKVVVSTDSPEIAEIAISAGAEVPFIRPTDLAGDFIATVPVIQHAIFQLKLSDRSHVCCIYPTAAFLTAQILTEAVMQQQKLQADFVMPVTKFSCPIERALTLSNNGLLSMQSPEHLNTRTQDCKELYHDAGQFYYGTVSAWLSNKDFYQQQVAAITIPKYLAHDIDNLDDWILAELIFPHVAELNQQK